MPATVYLVTGGCRSGKSSYAQKLCEQLCPNPIYLATSSANGEYHDDDMADRIKRHQDDRGEKWTTVEEPLYPSRHLGVFKSRVVLVDCLTLWLTNYMMKYKVFKLNESEAKSSAERQEAAEMASQAIKEEFEMMFGQWNTTYVFVTNEIGSGTHATDAVSRTFVDHQGWLNQYVASKAVKVVHMVAGQPSIIKKEVDSRLTSTRITDEDREEAWMLDKFLSSRPKEMDKKGYFLVKVIGKKIVASFFSCITNDKGEICDLEGNKIKCCSGKKYEPMKVWEARTAKELTVAIFEDWKDAPELVSISHAAYIGREAQRAEHCLHSNLPFQQD